MLARFGVGEEARGAIARINQARGRLIPLLAVQEMLPDNAREFGNALAEQRFHGFADAPVQFAAARREQTLVGHVLSQRVLEAVLEFGLARALANQVFA